MNLMQQYVNDAHIDMLAERAELISTISEIKDFIKRCDESSWDSSAIRTELTNTGHPVLGAGYFSTTYAYTDTLALKVCHRSLIDNCRHYYDYCLANPSPFHPKIHLYQELRGHNMYFVLMPIYKRQHIDGESLCHEAEDSINPEVFSLLQYIERISRNGSCALPKAKLYQKLRKIMKSDMQYNLSLDSTEIDSLLDNILRSHKTLIREIYRIKQYMMSVMSVDDWSFDLHGQNIMFDQDYNIIITDPVA